MKTKTYLSVLAMGCAVAALVGYASSDPPTSESSLDENNLEGTETLSPTGSSQSVILDERAFRNLDLDTNGAVTLEGWHFDTNNGANGNFGTLDENGLQINLTKFLTQSPKYFQLYSIFGGSDQTNNNNNNTDFSWDGQQFQPQGLRLFTIRF